MTEDNERYHVYVGTYGDEADEAIQLLEFNSKDGSLNKLAGAKGVKNPSYVTVNQAQDRLYAVSELEAGQVVSFDVDLKTSKLTEINRQATKGNAPCYLTLDEEEQQLLTVNYGEGTTIVHHIAKGGSIGSESDLKTYEDKDKSHPHTVVQIPSTNKYIVTDLGLTKLYLYELDYETSTLVLINEIDAVEGSGPRHIAIEPVLRRIYVVNEFNSRISVYSYDERVENLELIQEITTIPAGFDGDNYCADIHIAHSKSILYASNRGHHSIAVYKILEDGSLVALDHISTVGKWPRNFAILPNEEYMLVANEHTNSIVIMKIGPDGIPQPTGSEFAIQAPVCLQIVAKQ